MTNILQTLTAFGAGILSFFAPCVFPLIPAFICFITGLSAQDLTLSQEMTSVKRRLILSESVLFILGFSLVFVTLGASASFLGSHFVTYKQIIRMIGGIVLILFGLHLVGLLKIKFLQYEKRIHLKTKPISWLGSLFVGMAFGFGWTPCVGPILGGILVLAATSETLVRGVTLLSFYSLGLALPFLLVSIGINQMLSLVTRIEKYLRVVTVISGILLIVIGITMLIPNACAFSFSPSSNITEQDEKEKNAASDFVLPTVDGQTLQLTDFKGKIVILNFWGMDCPACQSQILVLLKLYEEYKDKELEVIGINLDRGSKETLKAFSELKKITYPIIRGNEQVAEDYGGIIFIPTTFIIDQEMNIVKKYFGNASFDAFKSEIERLLNN